MQNGQKVTKFVTINNRFSKIYSLNLASMILSAIIFSTWLILWLIASFGGYMSDNWWSGFIIEGIYALTGFSSLYCYGKAKRYYYYDYDPSGRADDNEKKVNVATNLMWNSWSIKTNTNSFITADILISYGLFELFATIASVFMVWANIKAIQVFILVGLQIGVPLEFSIFICIVSVIMLIMSRVLIWASTGLLAQNCADVGREYNAIIAERKRRNEAEQRIADELNRREADVKLLLAESGFKFFLKYYPQLVRVGVRDVVVEEDYSPTEKNERLKAAKKLIDSGLAPVAAQQILEKFSDLLTSEEKELALRIAG